MKPAMRPSRQRSGRRPAAQPNPALGVRRSQTLTSRPSTHMPGHRATGAAARSAAVGCGSEPLRGIVEFSFPLRWLQASASGGTDPPAGCQPGLTGAESRGRGLSLTGALTARWLFPSMGRRRVGRRLPVVTRAACRSMISWPSWVIHILFSRGLGRGPWLPCGT